MPDEKKQRRTLRELYEKQERLEMMIEQVLLRLPISAQSDILKTDVNKVDKENPFWDEEKQAYSIKSYREQHPREKEAV